uniref:Uncharacterized protein n=1 Tax=Plectus sambesii TaxID=2011161 RepID=A0A914VRJ2_9BILA
MSEGKKPFIWLKTQSQADGVNMNSFDILDFNRRLPTFTDQDWSRYLSGLGAVGEYFPTGQETVMTKARDLASAWMLANVKSLSPIDYYNYLGFLERYFKHYNMPMDNASQVDYWISKWFSERFDTLEPNTFLEIFMRIAHLHSSRKLRRTIITPTNLRPIVVHATTELVKDADVYEILGLLYIIHYFDSLVKHSRRTTYTIAKQRLMTALAERDSCVDDHDIQRSLLFAVDSHSPSRAAPGYKEVQKRHIFLGGAHFDPAWRWIRSAVESAFAHERLIDLRQVAAFAAVRAYRWKNVAFTPNQVSGYLLEAAKPYIENPAIVFESRDFSAQLPHHIGFRALLAAVRCAANSNLPEMGKMPIRLDDHFWDRFFEMLTVEVPKLGDERAYMFPKLMKQFNVVKELTPRERSYISRIFTSERIALLAPLEYQYSPDTMLMNRRHEKYIERQRRSSRVDNATMAESANEYMWIDDFR